MKDERIRTTIYVNKQNWNDLGKYIDCTKSDWINKVIERKVNQHDDVAELERKLKEIEIMQKNLQEEFEFLTDEKDAILKQRELNDKNFELIEQAMRTIRIVANNQGYVEQTRVEYIANKFNLKVQSLANEIKRQGIEIKDIEQRKDTDNNMHQPY
ncbi:hypothetical protein IKD48_03040 [bacterium]|nr:hypothetical protein [bacterium]